MKTLRYSDLPKEFRLILKKYHMAEVHDINISSSFLARARCKTCGQGPAYYFSVRKPYMYLTVNDRIFTSKAIRKWIKSLITSWYLSSEPRFYTDMKDFKTSFEDKHFVPILYRTRGADVVDRDNI